MSYRNLFKTYLKEAKDDERELPSDQSRELQDDEPSKPEPEDQSKEDLGLATPSMPKKRGVPREFRRRNKKMAYMQDMLYRTLANAGFMKADEFGKKKFGRGYFRGADGLYGKGTQKAIDRLRAKFPDAPKRMPSFSKSVDSLIEYLKVKEDEVRSSKLAMDKAKKYSADEIGSVLKNMNLVVSPDDPKAKDLIDKLMRAQAKGTPLSLKTIKLAGDTALQSESKEPKSYEEGWKDYLNETVSPADLEPVINALEVLKSKAQAAAMAAPVEKEVVAGDKDAALQLHQKATKLFRDKKYEEAAMAFGDVYEKGKRPASIYNSARSYEMAGRNDMAVTIFKKYISLPDASPEGKEAAQAKIEALEA